MADQAPTASQNQATGDLEEYNIISDEDVEEIRGALERGSLEDAASKIMENLRALESVRLNIAVTGETGAGKSSFVNAMRELGDEDEGSAPTDVTETTRVPTAYGHPKHPGVTLWDLPGIGSPRFKAATYLEQVKFSRYDFFVIIASERFRDVHAQLAHEIKQMGKSFYFVRSKIDADLNACKKRRSQTYDEEKILKNIKEECQHGLEAEGVASPQVFLLSSWELGKYDFILLEETLERELDRHKRHAFLLTLPNISVAILQKKKSALQRQVWKMAILSCAVGAVPIPGVSIACDVSILIMCLISYRRSFGLDGESLGRLAEKVGKPVEDLKEAIKSPLSKEISRDLVLKLLTKASVEASKKATIIKINATIIKNIIKLIPIIGSLVGGGTSYITTFLMLKSSLNEVAEDAQNVLLRALDSTV